jgi:hypothetical protein
MFISGLALGAGEAVGLVVGLGKLSGLFFIDTKEAAVTEIIAIARIAIETFVEVFIFSVHLSFILLFW